ncbi:hypothetical protein WR25_02972 [Diploscapter pachys]|uniref:LIM zinc-binding domain-containing protein n=1 Tax=Diploscapter pachys TaxID=2018661 RepID=A0A2A2K3L7_9BILA|nr:hypothetical protein WR25_02972 [Diploscapter pachys]
MDEHDVRLPDEFDHAQIVIGRLFGAREHFEAVLGKGRGSLSAGGYHNGSGHSPVHLHAAGNNNSILAAGGQYQRSPSSCSNSSSSSEKERERERKAMRAMADPVYNFKAKVPNSQKVIEYAWAPISDEIIIDKYMRALPEDLRPIVGTIGEENRRSRLQYQLPLYDCNVENSRFTDENDKKALGKFVENVRKNVIGMGKLIEVDGKLETCNEEDDDLADSLRKALGTIAVKCHECHKEIPEGEVGIKTDHGPKDDIWHPNCFKCAQCDQLLVDIIYFYHKGKYYCGRHFADQHYPRCSGCDELIFAREYTFAEEKSWHFDHFACFKCDLKLGGHRYMTKDEQPHCIDCYMKYYAKVDLYPCKNKFYIHF